MLGAVGAGGWVKGLSISMYIPIYIQSQPPKPAQGQEPGEMDGGSKQDKQGFSLSFWSLFSVFYVFPSLC